MRTISETYDVVVCGGGLAGFSAAVAAARQGARTCLIQDRPVLGGNSSSEVRVTPHGAAAFHGYARETGILSEVLIEERSRNHEEIFENGWTNSVWDLVLYDVARTTEGLTLRVNTTVVAVRMDGEGLISERPAANIGFGFLHRPACVTNGRISAIVCRVANAEVEVVISAKLFIDCTGDGIVADLAGCEWRMGSEGTGEFGEGHAPAQPSRDTMGSSIHFRARNIGRPAPYTPPDWAVKHEDARYFYKQGRIPKEVKGGFWWLEIGVPWDTIHDAEDIRHELTRHTLGVWDWIKNRDPRTRELAANYALDWIGQVPGKRESRRVIGKTFLTEGDIQDKRVFPDEVAFGGWFLDLHTPGGLLAPTSEPASAEGYAPTSTYSRKSYVGPYGLPLGMLISKDVGNLLFAGRNVSASHAALGTVRVMATTALMGQAAGTACAVALQAGINPDHFSANEVSRVQQRLLRDGCFLPHVGKADPGDLAVAASVSSSSSAVVSRVQPDDPNLNSGMGIWRDQEQPTGKDELLHRRGQWIAVSTSRIESLSVLLTNLSAEKQVVRVWLQKVRDIWDYRIDEAESLASGLLEIPPGARQWATWKVGVPSTPGHYLRLDLGENPKVCWHQAGGILPGHLSAFDMGYGQMRRYGAGVTLAFQVDPPQSPYQASNVLTGVTRPHRWTNLWRSDPAQALPQWLEFSWDKEQVIGSIELTFPGHLVREYHAYGPFYRDPQCPRDYSVEIEMSGGGAWETVLEVTGNYQRRRTHVLAKPSRASKLRLVIKATHGDPSAAAYEVRIYPPGS